MNKIVSSHLILKFQTSLFGAIFLVGLLIVSSCGKRINKSGEEESISKSEQLINDRQYEEALTILEKLHQKNPQDQTIRTKLLHATAGAGGFEALTLISVAQEVEKQVKVFKKNLENLMDQQKSENPYDMIKEIEKVFKPIPYLSAKQSKRLDQAIALYQDFDIDPEQVENYSNFKWGALHVFRMAVNMKLTIKAFRTILPEGESANIEKIELILIPGLGSFGQDLFMSYRLFGSSFDRIQEYSKSIDKVIGYIIKSKNFKLKVNTKARTQAQFYYSLLRDNTQGADVVIRKILDEYIENDQTQATRARIESLIRLSLQNILGRNRDMETGLGGIFSDDLKKSMQIAIERSLEHGNFNPLREFFHSEEPGIRALVGYFKVITGEIVHSDLPEDIRAEVEALIRELEKVDREELLKTGIQ